MRAVRRESRIALPGGGAGDRSNRPARNVGERDAGVALVVENRVRYDRERDGLSVGRPGKRRLGLAGRDALRSGSQLRRRAVIERNREEMNRTRQFVRDDWFGGKEEAVAETIRARMRRFRILGGEGKCAPVAAPRELFDVGACRASPRARFHLRPESRKFACANPFQRRRRREKQSASRPARRRRRRAPRGASEAPSANRSSSRRAPGRGCACLRPNRCGSRRSRQRLPSGAIAGAPMETTFAKSLSLTVCAGAAAASANAERSAYRDAATYHDSNESHRAGRAMTLPSSLPMNSVFPSTTGEPTLKRVCMNLSPRTRPVLASTAHK